MPVTRGRPRGGDARRAVALEHNNGDISSASHMTLGEARLGQRRTSALPSIRVRALSDGDGLRCPRQLAQAHTVLLHGVTVQTNRSSSISIFPRWAHWLRGLVLLAEDDPLQASGEFQREEGQGLDRLWS
jgi:hypothetical protein